MNTNTNFPTPQQHASAWESLARAIATRAGKVMDTAPTSPPSVVGELTIIGSGIESVGFTLGDEDLLRTADAVFFCVADPSTVVWVKSIRPDAYDLYVLYDDSKPRYTTYMQMAESMLHFVREGKKVTAIYYGHPGIFVLATHRAILIARREGHKAVMRPAVCALDCLCADLGVDPCHPGMQTHEATDMLIRGRIPDTSLHVVLWQVGLIGEMGYRRQGYLNQNFSVFIDYLQQHYGEDYPVTNYVASRYPTIPPMIDTLPLSALHDPKKQVQVTGISTFYLAPKLAAESDPSMLERLGMLKPGQTVRPADGPLREIGRYGPRERKAFESFSKFRIPKAYQWQNDTAASRFIIALRQDFSLRELYASNPQAALDSPAWRGLSQRERSFLARRDAGSVQVAAKGLGDSPAENRAFLDALFNQKAFLTQFSRRLAAGGKDPRQTLGDWSASQGFPLDWARLRGDKDWMARHHLFPWAGAYQTKDGQLLMLTGDGPKAKLWLDGSRVRSISYRLGELHWQAKGGENGFFKTDVDLAGRRRLVGALWPDGEVAAPRHRCIALEAEPGTQNLSQALGRYLSADSPDALDIEVAQTAERGRHIQVALNGSVLAGPVAYAGRKLTVGSRTFELASNGPGGPGIWIRQALLPPALACEYAVSTVGGGALQTFALSAETVWVNGQTPAVWDRQGTTIAWHGGPTACPSGQVTLIVDAATLCPGVFGLVGTSTGDVRKCFGQASLPPDAYWPDPQFGLSATAWKHYLTAATQGAGFFWYPWEKASMAAKLVNTRLSGLMP